MWTTCISIQSLVYRVGCVCVCVARFSGWRLVLSHRNDTGITRPSIVGRALFFYAVARMWHVACGQLFLSVRFNVFFHVVVVVVVDGVRTRAGKFHDARNRILNVIGRPCRRNISHTRLEFIWITSCVSNRIEIEGRKKAIEWCKASVWRNVIQQKCVFCANGIAPTTTICWCHKQIFFPSRVYYYEKVNF